MLVICKSTSPAPDSYIQLSICICMSHRYVKLSAFSSEFIFHPKWAFFPHISYPHNFVHHSSIAQARTWHTPWFILSLIPPRPFNCQFFLFYLPNVIQNSLLLSSTTVNSSVQITINSPGWPNSLLNCLPPSVCTLTSSILCNTLVGAWTLGWDTWVQHWLYHLLPTWLYVSNLAFLSHHFFFYN